MSERDEGRYIKVRASVVHDGEDRIKELKAELADRVRRHAADVEERDRKIAELRGDIRKLEDLELEVIQSDAYEEKLEADNARLRECLKRSELICGNCGKLAERHNEAVHLRDVISALEHEIVAKDARIRELEDGLVMEQTLHMLDHAALDALKAQVDREAK